MPTRSTLVAASLRLAVLAASTASALAAKPAAPPADPAIAYLQFVDRSDRAALWVMNQDGARRTRLYVSESANGLIKPAMDPWGDAVAASRMDATIPGSAPQRTAAWVWDIVKNTTNPSFTPSAANMRKLAFSEAELATDPTTAIYGQQVLDLAWSPDGMRITARVSAREIGSDGVYDWAIRVWTWNDGTRTDGHWDTLFDQVAKGGLFSPTWSPDGSQVAFVREAPGGVAPYEICVVSYPPPAGGWTTCDVVPSEPGDPCLQHRKWEIAWRNLSAAPAFAFRRNASGANVYLQDGIGCEGPLAGSVVKNTVSWTPDDRALVFDTVVEGPRSNTFFIHQLCVDGADPVAGPNRRLVLLQATSGVPREPDRRRFDPDGTPNICDDPTFPSN